MALADALARLNAYLPLARQYAAATSWQREPDPAQLRQLQDSIRRVYPDYEPSALGSGSARHQRDEALFRDALVLAAGRIAQVKLDRMDEILETLRLRLREAMAAQQLAYQVRAWLPFVSRAPFVVFPGADRRAMEQQFPDGPSAPEQAAVPDGAERLEDADAEIDESPPPRVSRAQQENELSVFTPWRPIVTSGNAREPRAFALAVSASDSEAAFRESLYRRQPGLILLPHIQGVTPARLVEILRTPDETQRNARLQRLLSSKMEELEQARNELRARTRSLRQYARVGRPGRGFELPDVDWERLAPLQEAALATVLADFPSSAPLQEHARQVFRRLQPLTFDDAVSYVGLLVFALSIAVPPAGAGLLAVRAIHIVVDAAILYATLAENARRRELNAFSSIDAALAVASPESPAGLQVLLMAAGCIVPRVLAGGRRAIRESIERAIGREAAESLPAPRRALTDTRSGRVVESERMRSARAAPALSPHVTSAAVDVVAVFGMQTLLMRAYFAGEDQQSGPQPLTAVTSVATPLFIQDLLRRAMEAVRARQIRELGGPGRQDPMSYGDWIHQAMAAELNLLAQQRNYAIFAELPFSELVTQRGAPNIPQAVLDQRVHDFIDSLTHLDVDTRRLMKRQFRTTSSSSNQPMTVGRLRPDAVFMMADNHVHVVDWTTTQRNSHLAKTRFYEEVLRTSGMRTSSSEVYYSTIRTLRAWLRLLHRSSPRASGRVR